MPQPKQKKNGASDQPISAYIPTSRYRWVEFTEKDEGDEGDVAFRAKVRAHLTGEELETLVWEKSTPMTEMYEMFAPLVVDWNAAEYDASGAVVQVEPPATGGPKQFEHIPVALFFQIVIAVKSQSVSPVDPKPWRPSAATHAPSSESSTANA